ncbi:MAG: glycosyltransferase family 2 protein [Candidatus Omnitrophica bacterium]|nr:glycosyltransferase family 2 protein [Candidatus Omnitrophota bacterium]MDD5042211.1 glycosyltransferase family 2 protein [Candidatus Omnitrophota bacterium]MDD5500066.1 glycosyltransferase family 2 protein [Candidatus Omnitrophota bacterium]
MSKSKERDCRRFFEIVPGFLSWGIIFSLVFLSIVFPVACAIIIISFDFYWIIRTVYLTTLLIMAHHQIFRQKGRNWLELCLRLDARRGWPDLRQLVIFPVCNEGPEVLRPSLEALRASRYPKDKFIVVMAFEERNPYAHENAALLEKEFGSCFGSYLSTFHPDGLPGEGRTKGANATWGAREAKKLLDSRKIGYEHAIVSCFDADTCVDPEYFGCLSYHFLVSDKPHQASYQPMPVYNNNIWQAPSFARLIEISSSFCQMIESMRLEKFVTFSSHSMSFKTLVEVDYWPRNMVSDDSVIYWKGFLHYNGDYRVIPLYITVSMDVAYSSNIFKTIIVQYKQKRRWAWGVENFPFVATRLVKNSNIGLFRKTRRLFHLLESHVTWAVWAVILVLIGPLPIFFGGRFFSQTALAYNLPKITGILFQFTLFTSLTWIFLSWTILPPRPRGIGWFKNIILVLEWFFVPGIILVVGSFPALDAQSRLMLARYMEFNPTLKGNKVL